MENPSAVATRHPSTVGTKSSMFLLNVSKCAEDLTDGRREMPWALNKWVWVKIKLPGDRRFWSMLPFPRIPVWVQMFDPPPNCMAPKTCVRKPSVLEESNLLPLDLVAFGEGKAMLTGFGTKGSPWCASPLAKFLTFMRPPVAAWVPNRTSVLLRGHPVSRISLMRVHASRAGPLESELPFLSFHPG